MIRDWYGRGFDVLLDYALCNKPAARRLVVGTAVTGLVTLIALAQRILQ